MNSRVFYEVKEMEELLCFFLGGGFVELEPLWEAFLQMMHLCSQPWLINSCNNLCLICFPLQSLPAVLLQRWKQ